MERNFLVIEFHRIEACTRWREQDADEMND